MDNEAQPLTPEREAVIAEWPAFYTQELRLFAGKAPAAFDAYTEHISYFTLELRPFITLALCDEDLALRILAMPFMQVGQADGGDAAVLAALARLTDPDVGDVDDVLANPLFEGGITEVDRAPVRLLVMEYEHPEAAALMLSVPWIEDVMREGGLGDDEIQLSRAPLHHYSVYALIEMADRSSESLIAFLGLSWMQDQRIQTEDWLIGTRSTVKSSIHTIASRIMSIARKGDATMAGVLAMPFLQTLEPHDRDTLEVLSETSDARHSSTDGGTPLRQLLADPALAGGITDDSLGDVALADLRVRAPDTAGVLESMPWIQDGVSPSEGQGILSLWHLAVLDTDVLDSVVGQPWVEDGLTVYESAALRTLEQLVIASRNMKAYPWHEEYVLTIPDKSFMDDIGPSDAALLRAAILLLQNGGIRERTDLLETILESGDTQLAERTITLPLAGEVALSIVWPAGLESDPIARQVVDVSRTMDVFERAVREVEEFMGQPFPQKHAVVLIHDYPTGAQARGGREAFITIDPRISESVSTIAHEVTHAYWSAIATWIVEGAADFMGFLVTDSVPDHSSTSCRGFNTIYDLIRALVIEGQFQHRICNYTMGSRLFLDLHDSLGEDAFRQGFAELYLRLWGFVPTEGCVGIDEGVCYVKAAFVDSAAPEDAAVAEEIIDRRYFGTAADTS